MPSPLIQKTHPLLWYSEVVIFIYIFFWILYCTLLCIYLSFIIFDDDNEEAHDCGHMTYHMIWGHRPRVGWSGLDGWCQGACYYQDYKKWT